ncbi:MAG: hypothetical protein MR561_07140 [Prevotella sp.]|nr:hypothetical protein [Prevotella sp.]
MAENMSLKIENDARVEMKIYTLPDKIELSIRVDGKEISIPFTRKQAELFGRRLQVLKNTLI